MNVLAIRLLNSYFVPLILGMSVVLYLFRRKPLSLFLMLALSWGVGLGLLAQYMLILTMIGIRLSVTTIAVPIMGVVLMLIYLSGKGNKGKGCDLKFNDVNHDRTGMKQAGRIMVFCLLIACIMFQTFFVFWDSFHLPISYFDAFSSIAMKAKILFYTNSFEHIKDVSNPSYPLQVPLMLTWLSLNLGYFDEQLIKTFIPFTYLSFLCLQYFFLREWTGKLWSLLGVVLLTGSYMFVHHASACLRDFTMLYYNCAAIMMILVWDKRKDDSFLILAALLSGFATFTKLEGSAYWAIHLLLLCILIFFLRKNNFKSRLGNLLIFLIPSLSIGLLYHLFKVRLGIPNTERLAIEFSMENLGRIPRIISRITRGLINYQHWNITWLLCALSFFISIHKLKSNTVKLILCALIFYFGMYFMLALTNTVNFNSIAGSCAYDVLPRVLLHFFPVATWLIVLLQGQNNNRDRNVQSG